MKFFLLNFPMLYHEIMQHVAISLAGAWYLVVYQL